MIYADYDFYRDSYLGSALDGEEFPRLALRASRFLDYYTKGQIAAYAGEDEIKSACCALAEQYKLLEKAEALAQSALTQSESCPGGEILRETVGSHSVTRRGGGESAKAAQEAAGKAKMSMAVLARQYLAGTGLLYRGGERHGHAAHGDGI